MKRRSPSTGKAKRAGGLRAVELDFPTVKGSSPAARRDRAFAEAICSIGYGKVATYGQIAAAAGYPRHHRAVARLLRTATENDYPWQRVLGAQGEIKLRGSAAAEQRLRLKMEGVTFVGRRVDLEKHQHEFAMGDSEAGGRPKE